MNSPTTITAHQVLRFELQRQRLRTIDAARLVLRRVEEFVARMERDDAEALADLGDVPCCPTEPLRWLMVESSQLRGYAAALESFLRHEGTK